MSEAVAVRDVRKALDLIIGDTPVVMDEAHRMYTYFRETWPYRPPEFDGQCWKELTKVVNEECVPGNILDQEWKIKVVAHLMGMTEDEIRVQFKDRIPNAT